MVLDRTFDDGHVHTVNVGISSCTMSQNIIDGLVQIHLNTNFIFPTLETIIDETAATVVLSSEGGTPQSFTQAAPNELKLGKGG